MSDIACQATLAFVVETKLLVYNDMYLVIPSKKIEKIQRRDFKSRGLKIQKIAKKVG